MKLPKIDEVGGMGRMVHSQSPGAAALIAEGGRGAMLVGAAKLASQAYGQYQSSQQQKSDDDANAKKLHAKLNAANREADAKKAVAEAKALAVTEKAAQEFQLKIETDAANAKMAVGEAAGVYTQGDSPDINADDLPDAVRGRINAKPGQMLPQYLVQPELTLYEDQERIKRIGATITDPKKSQLWQSAQTVAAAKRYSTNVSKARTEQKTRAESNLVGVVGHLNATGREDEAIALIESNQSVPTTKKAELYDKTMEQKQTRKVDTLVTSGTDAEIEQHIVDIRSNDPAAMSHLGSSKTTLVNKMNTELNKRKAAREKTFEADNAIIKENIDLSVKQGLDGKTIPNYSEKLAYAKATGDTKRERDLIMTQTVQPFIPIIKAVHPSQKQTVIDKAMAELDFAPEKEQEYRNYLENAAAKSITDLARDPNGTAQQLGVGKKVAPPEDFFGNDFGRYLTEAMPAAQYAFDNTGQKGWNMPVEMMRGYIKTVTEATPEKQLQSAQTVVETLGKEGARDFYNRLGDKGLSGSLVIAGQIMAEGTPAAKLASETIAVGRSKRGSAFDFTQGAQIRSRKSQIEMQMGKLFALGDVQNDWMEAMTDSYIWHKMQEHDTSDTAKPVYAKRAYKSVFGSEPVTYNNMVVLPTERGETTKTFEAKVDNIHHATYKDAKPLAGGLTYEKMLTDIREGHLTLISIGFNRYRLVGVSTDGSKLAPVKYENGAEFIFSVPDAGQYVSRKGGGRFGENGDMSVPEYNVKVKDADLKKRKEDVSSSLGFKMGRKQILDKTKPGYRPDSRRQLL